MCVLLYIHTAMYPPASMILSPSAIEGSMNYFTLKETEDIFSV